MNFNKEEQYLIDKDSKLKKIIIKNGHIDFKPNKSNQFDTLVGIIISQFISTKAANTIFQNIRNNFGTEHLSEKNFKNLSLSQIKKLGLSTNKARSIKELSNLYLKNNFDNLENLDNEIINNKLLSIFGIGPWSINMFEIFCMGKLDVFSSKDAGLRLAMNKLGMIKPKSQWSLYDDYAEKWSPYKTIASLHLWKVVD